MTKRIWALIHFGYNFTFLRIAAVNLAVRGTNPRRGTLLPLLVRILLLVLGSHQGK